MVKIQDGGSDRRILSRTEDRIAEITLNRPEKKNAITHEMWRELRDLVTDFGSGGDVRTIVISGQGRDFCAGADIAEFENVRSGADTASEYEADNNNAFSAIRNCPVPVIAAIRGICYGGGFGIAAAADLRIATPDSSFAVPAARLGLAYPAQAMADIVDSVGPQMAKYLTFTAKRIDAQQAQRAGFLYEIVDDEMLDQHVRSIAETIAANAPLSVEASKASIRAVLSGSPDDMAHAKIFGMKTFESQDYAEGRRAFAEKRKAEFAGK